MTAPNTAPIPVEALRELRRYSGWHDDHEAWVRKLAWAWDCGLPLTQYPGLSALRDSHGVGWLMNHARATLGQGPRVLTKAFETRAGGAKGPDRYISRGLPAVLNRPSYRHDSGKRLQPGYVRLDLDDGRTVYTPEDNTRPAEYRGWSLTYDHSAQKRYRAVPPGPTRAVLTAYSEYEIHQAIDLAEGGKP
jgi:hypothetical protein